VSKSISIITINLNNREGLYRTIESVKAQTGAEFEFIVVDGGSTDGSVELIKNSKVISGYISEKDSGVYNAQNKGIDLAHGEYLLFLNSGDCLYEQDTLSKIRPLLDGKTDIVYGNLMIEENGHIIPGYMPATIDLRQMMEDTLWHPVSFISARLFKNFGKYDESYKICGDYDFFFRTIIGKKVSTRHSGIFVSVFQHNGLSSQPANIPIIQKEKHLTQKKYLGESGIRSYKRKKKMKNLFTRIFRWFR